MNNPNDAARNKSGGAGEGKRKAKMDLIPSAFPGALDWGGETTPGTLAGIFDYVNTECDRAIAWYFASKKKKRFLGYFTRLFAIFAFAVAGCIPIISEIFKNNGGASYIAPAWSSIAIAIGAVLISIDRFGGYTSGWVRYVRAGQSLVAVKSEYQIKWERCASRGADGNPKALVDEKLKLCAEYLERVNGIVQAETDAWAAEFQSVLTELDKRANKQGGK